MTEDEFAKATPVQAEAFRQLRRLGYSRADGSHFEVNGTTWRMLADKPCSVDVHQLTMESLGPVMARGYKLSMLATLLDRRVPYGVDVDALGMLLRSLTDGDRVAVPEDPQFRTNCILSWVGVPTYRRRLKAA